MVMKSTERKVDAIIQARLGSTRLPRKVLADLNGRPLIEHVVNRVKASRYVDRVVVATSSCSSDDDLVSACLSRDLLVYRGDAENVLARYIGACEEFECGKIIRVCADNPFLDVNLLDKQLDMFTKENDVDYCTYTTFDGLPIILKPLGLFAEAVTFSALVRSMSLIKSKKYFEHVTMFIYEHPEVFRIETIPLGREVNANYRFTVDFQEDLDFCREILSKTDDISLASLISLLRSWPELEASMINFSKKHDKVY